jgi:hypothetical protein
MDSPQIPIPQQNAYRNTLSPQDLRIFGKLAHRDESSSSDPLEDIDLDLALIDGFKTSNLVFDTSLPIPIEFAVNTVETSMEVIMESKTLSGTLLGIPSWVTLPGERKPRPLNGIILNTPAGQCQTIVK